MIRWRLGGALLLGASIAACSGAGASAGEGEAASARPDETVELVVFGAASLRDALEAVRVAYEAARPGTTLTIATDSSAALATQVEQGAPADVFLSADEANPRRLADAGLTLGAPVVFARNELTVVTPADDPGGVATPADLARPGLKVVAAGSDVPITRYAEQLVANLAREPGYPADFADAYAANVVSREDNVRAVLAKIELGEGDAGIVYVTDTIASDGIRRVEVPAAANVRATYEGVVVETTEHPAEAASFLDWLAGPEGRAILAPFGFLPPDR